MTAQRPHCAFQRLARGPARWRVTLGALGAVCAAAACAHADDPVAPASQTDAAPLTGPEIVALAHAAAGGETWVRPETLTMTGYGLFWRGGPEPSRHDPHVMWRVYPGAKTDAHQADGKVRIDSMKDGAVVFQIAFDGAVTYDQNGAMDEPPNSDRWASNFGFGVIRHALDDGYEVARLADDLVDGRPVYTVQVIAPAGRETLFAVAQDDHALLKVGFDTPRGWHERIYSEFFTKPGVDWVQPGRVRLFYDGVKANEIIWTDFEVNTPIEDGVFVLGDG